MERFLDEEKYMQSDFAKEFNMKFIDLVDDNFILELSTKKGHINGLGMVHGGIMFTLADTAAGLLCIACGKKCVTLSSSMNFLGSSKGGKLITKTRFLHSGKSTNVVEVEVYDEFKRRLSVGIFTMYAI